MRVNPHKEARHRNLVRIMSQKELIQADVRKLILGLDVGQMSRMYNGNEAIGDEMAGKMERAMHLKEGSLSVPVSDDST